jgi:4-aminobutyrate aminotransferase-like enzyme
MLRARAGSLLRGVAALEEAITANTVAFLVEPIQEKAGVIIPPPSYNFLVVPLVGLLIVSPRARLIWASPSIG